MNNASVAGVILGLSLIFGAIYMGVNEIELFPVPAVWGIFISVPSLMIVLGGALSASMIAFQSNTLGVVFGSMFIVMTRRSPNVIRQKREIVALSTLATQGTLELEKAVRSIRNPFLRDGVQMLADDYSVDEIEDILGQRIEYRLRKERDDSGVVRMIARFCPAFGMTGTLIGLINMLSRMSFEGDALSHIGGDMAVAIVTTFYGLFLSYLVFIPTAVRLEKRTEEEIYQMKMISDSIRMIGEEWHPRKVEDYLNSYLPPGKRKRAKRLADYNRAV
ncbi:MAG: MotA/TolQ/ExbB proton channel family protein [Candidatus Electryonea clarkiae]|nr:MotA/TolQ/ExbB proton channel family protein [Candidatus Electryonea clarkiae]